MPLIKGKSKQALSKNIATEMDHGKPQKQAIAIAFSTRRAAKKKMAFGGKAEDDGNPGTPAAKPDDSRPPMDDYMSGSSMTDKRLPRKPDDKRLPEEEYMSDSEMDHRFAKGGSINPTLEQSRMGEQDDEDSLVDAIMRKHSKKKMAMGGYADGGEVEDGQADLSRNAQEEFNNEDQMSFDALRKENYQETPALEQATSPMDSGQHGHELTDEDENDMVERIRAKIRSKRGM